MSSNELKKLQRELEEREKMLSEKAKQQKIKGI